MQSDDPQLRAYPLAEALTFLSKLYLLNSEEVL